MRIAITGSHGVGKTTLAKRLLEHLNDESYQSKEDLMRIAVTGSHGTGKTTLSKLVTGRMNYRYIPESPFQAVQKGFSINEETPLEAEIWIFAKQVEMEMADGNWVADKCMIDLLAYAYHIFKEDKSVLDVLTRIARRNFPKYDLVIYLPCGEFPIEDDGYRSLDPVFQHHVDCCIRGLMAAHGIRYHRVTGTPEQRFDQVKGLMGQ